MFCVYEHIRPDTNAIFYVGNGSHRRANSKHRRNNHWNSVVAKAGGFSVRLVADDVDEELSFLVEEERIDQLKRIGLKLTNKTNGGEGPSGMRHTDETKRKIADAQRGEKHWTFGYVYTEANRAKLRAAREKFVFTPEIRKKISDAGKKRINSPEHRFKISQAKQNGGHHMAVSIRYNGLVFDCVKSLANYLGMNHATIRSRVYLNPSKWGYEVLGHTKDLKGETNGKH